METNHGFPETKLKFYEYGLQHLGFIKKLSVEEWAEVVARVRKRKDREEKETEVFLSGILQPQPKIRRIISRHKRGRQLQERIARGEQPTPELPRAILLRTPPPSGAVVHYSKPNTASTLIFPHSERPSDGLLEKLIINPNSTVRMLFNVPTFRVLKGLIQSGFVDHRTCIGQGLREADVTSSLRPVTAVNTISESPQDRGYLSHGISLAASEHQGDLKTLAWISAILANGRTLEVANKEDFLAFLDFLARAEINDSESPLIKFFALDFPGVVEAWTCLIGLSMDIEAGDAFRALVQIGFEIRDGLWIRKNVDTLVESAVKLGSRKLGELVERLLPIFVQCGDQSVMDSLLWEIIKQTDIEMMSKFVHAGVRFSKNLTWSYERAFSSIVGLVRAETNQQWINLLKIAEFDIDAFYQYDCTPDDVFTRFQPRDYPWNGVSNTTAIGWSMLDSLWLFGEHDVYEALAPYSKRASTEITISGLTVAARSGTEQLQQYISYRQPSLDRTLQVSEVLEAALSVASELGDVVAIASFCKAGVDPMARSIRSRIVPYSQDWYPLMRAALGKHLDAVLKLVEMGAELDCDTFRFNLLSAAIWTPSTLSNTKRLEQLGLVRYFLETGLARTYGVDAMIKAVVPPEHAHSDCPPNCVLTTTDDFVPDEEIIDMLIDAGVGLAGIAVRGIWDLLHYAIFRDCNLRTVEVLVSRGSRIHSNPFTHGGITMLHSAATSRSTDRLRIIELLLRSGVEWDSLTILEATLPPHGTELEVFLFLLDKSLLADWPEIASRWPPVLTRLLAHEASDALIYQAIEAGADISMHEHNKYGDYTPLQLAALKGRLGVARQLLYRGACINAPAFACGHTALQAACYAPEEKDCLELIQFLLKNGAYINAPGGKVSGVYNGGPALHCAVTRGSMFAFCLLLDAGADFHITNGRMKHEYMFSTLDVAARCDRLDMVDILLKKGAESATQGRTPYDGAIEFGTSPAIKELIRTFVEATADRRSHRD
ncbi:ankyrin [Nemania abortiva]|nr:ankyrin [Nemania abortiva]